MQNYCWCIHQNLVTVDFSNNGTVAGLPCIGNYHTVTVRPVPALVVLIHARGQQGWRAAVFSSGCCHLLHSASPTPRGEVTREPAAQGADQLTSDFCMCRSVINIGSRYCCVDSALREHMAEWFLMQAGTSTVLISI